jgi:hypothetical protein
MTPLLWNLVWGGTGYLLGVFTMLFVFSLCAAAKDDQYDRGEQ